MKNYIVAISSLFDNEIKQTKVQAENECKAFSKAMIDFTLDPFKKDEIELQNSIDYPTDIAGLQDFYINAEIIFSVIEI